MKGKDNAVVLPVRVPKPLADRIEQIATSNDRTSEQEAGRVLRLIFEPSPQEHRNASLHPQIIKS